jgi:O-antigen/teichoic acid export membrane protein
VAGTKARLDQEKESRAICNLDRFDPAISGSGSGCPGIGAKVKERRRTPKFSDTILLIGSQVGKWSLRLVFVLVAARALGPEKFGIYALLFSIVEFVAVASGGGYADYLTRETAKSEKAGWELAVQLILLRTAIAVLVGAAALSILSLLGYPRSVISATTWMLMTLAPRSFGESVQGVFRGSARYAQVLVIDLFLGLTLVAGSGYLLHRGGGLRTAVAIELIAACSAGVAAIVLGIRFWPLRGFSFRALQVVKSSVIFNVYGFIGNLYDRFDVVLLSKLAGNYATGIYSVAYRALGMTQIVGYGVLYALLPSLCRDSWDQLQQQQLERAMGLLLNASFVMVLATMVFAGPAVQLLLGPSYSESASALKILIWAVIFRYLNYSLNTALLAAGRERVFVITASVCLAVNFVGNLILIPKYSWRAAAALTIVTDLVSVVLNVRHLRTIVDRVPRPFGMVRSSLAFVALMTITAVCGRIFDPLAVGVVCLLLFLGFLQYTGMLSEYVNIWHAESSPLPKLLQ